MLANEQDDLVRAHAAAFADGDPRRPAGPADAETTRGEGVPVNVFQRIVHPDGRIETTFSCGGLLDALGVAHSDVMRDFGVLLDRVHPGDRGRYWNAIQTSARELAQLDFEHRCVCPSGEVLSCRTIAHLSRREDGAVAHHGITIDVTRQKRVEAALSDSEERFRKLADVSFDAVLIVEDGVFTAVNGRATELFGYDEAELIGRPSGSLASPEWREEIKRRTDARTEGRFELEIVHKDGRLVPVEVAVKHFTLEGRYMRVAAVRDCSERKRAEAALRDSEERYRRLIEFSPYGVVVVDADRIYFANRAAAEIVGADDPAKLVGLPWERFVPPDEHEALRARRKQLFAGQSHVPVTERRRLRLDGSEFLAESGAAAIVWNGRPAILGVFHDVTQRRRAEVALREASMRQERQLAELRRAKEQLERQSAELRETAARLDVLREAAERANAVKSKFLATASHELRQPFQALNLLTYSLGAAARDHDTRAIVGDMRRALSATERLLTALLDINRLEAGVLAPEVTNFPLADLFERMRVEFEQTARDRRLAFRVVATGATVRSDFELLAAIVRNFVSNSLKYTRSGKVLLGARRRGRSVRIEVWDTGIGIPADQLDHIFEEFVQLNAGHHHDGLGLGLTIARQTALLLGHSLNVRSALGRGSAFSVDVPLAAARPRRRRRRFVPGGHMPADLRRAEAAAAAQAGRSVLVIEDHADILSAMHRLLSAWDLRVEATDNVEAALDRLRAGGAAPDLIVVDHRLPGTKSGIDVLRQFADIAGRDIPALIVTGDTSTSQLRAMEAAGYPYLYKPVDPEMLRATISALLASDEVARTRAGA